MKEMEDSRVSMTSSERLEEEEELEVLKEPDVSWRLPVKVQFRQVKPKSEGRPRPWPSTLIPLVAPMLGMGRIWASMKDLSMFSVMVVWLGDEVAVGTGKSTALEAGTVETVETGMVETGTVVAPAVRVVTAASRRSWADLRLR